MVNSKASGNMETWILPKILKSFLSGAGETTPAHDDGDKEEAWKDLEPQKVVLKCLNKDKGIVSTLVWRTFSKAQIWVLRESFQNSGKLIAIVTIQEECCILRSASLSCFPLELYSRVLLMGRKDRSER